MVGQRVLAIHPKTRELRTASLLTTDIRSYHAQFDRTELGTVMINDLQLIPISGNEYYNSQQIGGGVQAMQLNTWRDQYLNNIFSKH